MNILLKPIAFVKNSRQKIEDDNWNAIESEIVFVESISEEALEGIEEFSHLEIIFYMNEVKDAKAIAKIRHPRNNINLPKVGTYAQRNKSRPNKIGLTTVKLLRVKGKSIFVKNLDALNNTPILDVKPYMKEFGPKAETKQPNWTTEIMKNYWK